MMARGQLIARGVEAGQEVARLLKAVEARWVDEKFPGEQRVDSLLELELKNVR